MVSLFRGTGPFASANVRWYAWFTTAFHARFYYPILAILFLDLGLTLSEFGALNAIWAVTILLAEVPSGALADLVGRRKLLNVAAALMVLEMFVLLIAPRDAGLWLFGFCALNRVLSGLAEAAASGADEALAYESLEDPEEWDEVLEVVMRLRAAAMVVAMIVGALLYDAGSIGWSVDLAHRLPLVLCLLQGVAAFWVSLKFVERCDEGEKRVGFAEVFAQTWGAARWVFTTKAAILIVVGGLLVDGVVRNFATINSEYYRLIEIPTFTFGFIAAGTSFLGMYVPRLSKHLARSFSPFVNFMLTAAWAFLCLYLLGKMSVGWGVLPGIGVMLVMSHLGFLMSCYLNDLASSEQRATVLSVKGLLFNIGYGTASLVFAAAVAHQGGDAGDDGGGALTWALKWQPWVFLAVFAIYVVMAKVVRMPRETRSH